MPARWAGAKRGRISTRRSRVLISAGPGRGLAAQASPWWYPVWRGILPGPSGALPDPSKRDSIGGIVSRDRRLDVLRAIVTDYVQTREPVGSRALVERHGLGVSPATIRNDMAALEEEGLIAQPHTSAGRIPTEKGYRLFVDRIDQIKPLTAAERRAIAQFLDQSVDFEDVIERAVRLLAQLTRQTAVLEFPQLRASKVRHLEVVPLSSGRATSSRALLVLISDSGRVDQRLVDFAAEYPDTDLESAAQVLRRLAAGRSGAEIAPLLASHLATVPEGPGRGLLEDLGRAVLEELASEEATTRIVMAGMANLARADTDFAHTITPVVEALEEQVVLLKLFSEMATDQAVSVSIGSENGHASLSETSLVTSTYETNATRAHLGVIGPTRMDYPTSMAMVSAVGRYLSRILSQ